MKTSATFALVVVLLASCRSTPDRSPPSSQDDAASGTPSGSFACMDCLTDSDCQGGRCVQFGADTACAPDCAGGAAGCAADATCQALTTPQGAEVSACIPAGETCGGPGMADASTGGPTPCNGLVPPDTTACCSACSPGASCQANGCYNGWWCNTGTCHCQSPPSCSGGDGGAGDAVHVGDPPTGSVTSSGGTVSRLYFAVVGDTRPAIQNDTANYPTAVITAIYRDLDDLSPRPEFSIATGDYNYASTTGTAAGAQIGKYMTAQGQFSNPSFFAMGNHECTGYTRSNCGAGSQDGITANYTAFMDQMIAASGQSQPYYAFTVNGSDGSWNAKFVVIAANAWSDAQATWLEEQMSAPTTYTFVVRHEPSSADTAPGTSPSDAIINQHPYTLLLVGHTHLYRHNAGSREVIIGLGGAPITSSDNFGYLIASQAPDGSIVVSEYDYQTGAPNQTFAVRPDGSPAP